MGTPFTNFKLVFLDVYKKYLKTLKPFSEEEKRIVIIEAYIKAGIDVPEYLLGDWDED